MRLEMKRDIAGQQQQDQHHDVEIFPVAPGQDLAGRGGRDQQQKARIDQHRRHQPVSAENVTAMRPAIQTTTSASSGVPCIGNRPVQFGIAVNRKPVMTAGR